MFIWLAYLAIPVVLVLLVRRRRDVPFHWLFWMFGAFIVSCGFTHFMDVVDSYVPLYRLSGLVKLLTAVVSWATVIALVRVVPSALSLRSPSHLEREVQERTTELTRINATLLAEIEVRRQTERRLRDSEERFRTLFEHAPSGEIMVGQDGKILLVNAQIERQFGYQREELIGRCIETLIPHRFRENHLGHRTRYFASPQPRLLNKGRELCGLHKGGSEFPVEIGLQPIQIEGDPFVLVSIVDISEHIQVELERLKTEERLRSSVEEKEVLLREIHHRVKNNLQVISSLLQLQAQHAGGTAVVGPMFQESQNRVRSMALVHERLYHSRDLVRVNFAEYLRNLVGSLFRTYRVDHAKVTLNLEAEEVHLAIDAAVPCGLVVNELITNCLKYAFPNGRSGVVSVRLTQVENDVVFQVCDDGVGLPEQVDLENPKTFGFRLITDLVDQLRGTIHIERFAGTGVRITFPATRRKGGTTAMG